MAISSARNALLRQKFRVFICNCIVRLNRLGLKELFKGKLLVGKCLLLSDIA